MDRRSRTSANPPTRRRRRLWTLLAAGVLLAAGAVPLTLSSLAQADPNSGSNSNRPVARRAHQPVRVELAVRGQGMHDRARPEGIRRGAGRTTAGLGQTDPTRQRERHDPAPVVGGLPAGGLQPHQPHGHRGPVQGHGRHVSQGRGEGLRRRGHQPHDRAGQCVLRRRQLHPVQLPRLHTCELPRPGRRVPVLRRGDPGLQ